MQTPQQILNGLPPRIRTYVASRGSSHGIPAVDLIAKLPTSVLGSPLAIEQFLRQRDISHVVATSAGGSSNAFENWNFEEPSRNRSRGNRLQSEFDQRRAIGENDFFAYDPHWQRNPSPTSGSLTRARSSVLATVATGLSWLSTAMPWLVAGAAAVGGAYLAFRRFRKQRQAVTVTATTVETAPVNSDHVDTEEAEWCAELKAQQTARTLAEAKRVSTMDPTLVELEELVAEESEDFNLLEALFLKLKVPDRFRFVAENDTYDRFDQELIAPYLV